MVYNKYYVTIALSVSLRQDLLITFLNPNNNYSSKSSNMNLIFIKLPEILANLLGNFEEH